MPNLDSVNVVIDEIKCELQAIEMAHTRRLAEAEYVYQAISMVEPYDPEDKVVYHREQQRVHQTYNEARERVNHKAGQKLLMVNEGHQEAMRLYTAHAAKAESTYQEAMKPLVASHSANSIHVQQTYLAETEVLNAEHHEKLKALVLAYQKNKNACIGRAMKHIGFARYDASAYRTLGFKPLLTYTDFRQALQIEAKGFGLYHGVSVIALFKEILSNASDALYNCIQQLDLCWFSARFIDHKAVGLDVLPGKPYTFVAFNWARQNIEGFDAHVLSVVRAVNKSLLSKHQVPSAVISLGDLKCAFGRGDYCGLDEQEMRRIETVSNSDEQAEYAAYAAIETPCAERRDQALQKINLEFDATMRVLKAERDSTIDAAKRAPREVEEHFCSHVLPSLIERCNTRLNEAKQVPQAVKQPQKEIKHIPAKQARQQSEQGQRQKHKKYTSSQQRYYAENQQFFRSPKGTSRVAGAYSSPPSGAKSGNFSQYKRYFNAS